MCGRLIDKKANGWITYTTSTGRIKSIKDPLHINCTYALDTKLHLLLTDFTEKFQCVNRVKYKFARSSFLEVNGQKCRLFSNVFTVTLFGFSLANLIREHDSNSPNQFDRHNIISLSMIRAPHTQLWFGRSKSSQGDQVDAVKCGASAAQVDPGGGDKSRA